MIWPVPSSPLHAYRWACDWLKQQIESARTAWSPHPEHYFKSRLQFGAEPLENRVMLSTFTVTNTGDAGPGTLRDAVDLANTNVGADIIEFNIAGSGVHTISPLSALPSLTEEAIIDGATQPGYAGTPLIEISGSLAGSAHGLAIGGNGSAINGLNINGFALNGIYIQASNVLVSNNYLGTDSTGTVGIGGGEIRVFATSSAGNQILDNLISGNVGEVGITLANANGTVIQGNKIGTDVTGTFSIPNGGGIGLDGAWNNQIGGSGPGEGNLISGNQFNGIGMSRPESNNNRVEGNFIGADVTGTQTIRNGWDGVTLLNGAHDNTIGGSAAGAGNLISGNDNGIGLGSGTANNLIEGNLIGTTADGANRMYAGTWTHRNGIFARLQGSGGNNIIRNNVVSANAVGINLLGAANNLVEGNWVGTDQTATIDLGNTNSGITIGNDGSHVAANNQILSNTIHYNRGSGIDVYSGTGNSFLGNSVYANSGLVVGSSGLGIDLGVDGVTANDTSDVDLGPNNAQNFPVLSSVLSGGGSTTIQGTLNSLADEYFRVEFFASDIQDVAGFGEGQQFLGSIDVLTNQSGNASLAANFPVEVPDGHVVSSTATHLVDHDANAATPLVPQDTSEFSQNIIVGAATPIGTFNMPIDGKLSVGIYDGNGDLIRTLFEALSRSSGPVELFWDGRDQFGNVVPGGDFEWRAIVHQAEAIDDGSVGDAGNPPYGGTDNNHFTTIVAVDSAGNVYEHSFFEEALGELRKWDASGNALWTNGNGAGGQALAVDNDYAYAAYDYSGENRILRYSSADGTFAGWAGLSGGHIVANATGGHGVYGMAVDSSHLWVSNNAENRIEIYDKSTGAFVSQFLVNNPLSIALDTLGNIWVVNNGDRVTRFDSAGTVLDELTGFDDPRKIAVGGPASNLYVADFGTSTVREFDSTTLIEVRELFGPAEPGPISDYLLRWSDGPWGEDLGDLAVDSAGNIIIADFGNQRVLTYDASGTIVRTRFSEYIPAPTVDPNVDPDILNSGVWQYDVDYTPGPTYGDWQLTHNWRPTDDSPFSQIFNLRRRLSNGGDYLFSRGAAGGVAVYALEPTGMRLSSIIGNEGGSLWNWADTNGDGQVQESEKSYDAGTSDHFEPMWIDSEGNFWIAHTNHWRGESTIVKVPLSGFDLEGNPVYDWVNRHTVVDADLYYDFDTNAMRVSDVNGDIYRVGTTELNRDFGLFFMGGPAVDRRDASGARINLMHLSEVAVAVATDSTGDYFYTGHAGGPQHWVRMYTNDGLMIAEGRIGPNNGSSGGWIDHSMGITAFTHPNGTPYVYLEEVFYGKNIRYRIDGIETLQRYQGNFTFGDAPVFTVINTNDSGPGSLRQAMLNANWNPGPDSIDFDIAGSGVHTINVLSELPIMEEATFIDGTTQPGYAGSPLIEISGGGITGSADGFIFYDGFSRIAGLVINSFPGLGINASGYGLVIEDNYIGTDATGTSAAGNEKYGIWILGAHNVVVRNNLVSGQNTFPYGGINISNAGGAVIQGNKIGTDVTGSFAIQILAESAWITRRTT